MPEEKKFIVEVGFGSKPFSTQGNRKIERDEVYIGLDTGLLASIAKTIGTTDIDLFAKAQERIDQRLPKRNRYHLVYADGMSMPFPDHSVSEVIFINTLSFTTVAEHARLLTVEASRVLKPKGLITVVEWINPNTFPFPMLNELMRSIGFKCLTAMRHAPVLGTGEG